MKKIVFFDTWLSGLRQIDAIAKHLHNDYKIVYLSIDKMNNKSLSKKFVSHNKSAYLNRIENDHYYEKIVDIAEYNNSMKMFFEIEKPDLCITISLHNLEQKWFNIASKYFKVPTYLLMHGIKGEAVFNKSKVNPLKKIFSYNTMKRLVHYNVLFFLYHREKRKLKVENTNSLSEWCQLIFNNNNFKFAPLNSYNVNYEKLFVTTQSDIAFFKKQYPTLMDSKFFVIGTLDMINIIEEIEVSKSKLPDSVLFLGQPLEPILSKTKYIDLILNLYRFCNDNKLKFVFRPHPREDVETVKQISDNGIEISDALLSHDLIKSLFAISFTSTALLTAISLKIPVVSFRIPNFIHPEFLENDIMRYAFNDVNELNSSILNEISIYNKNRDTFDITNPIEIISEEILIEFKKIK